MSDLGLAGYTPSFGPTTFILNLAKFIPAGFSILYYGCLLVGVLMLATAMFWQIDSAKGRNQNTPFQNLVMAIGGASMALAGEYIGYLGKGIFGEFQDMSVLLYTAQNEQNFAKVALVSFLYFLQLLGGIAFIAGIKMLTRIGSGRKTQSDSGAGVFWYALGGVALFFNQHTIGIFSMITGMKIANLINSL